ncbi:hypothetical protein B9G54_03650 [Alloscardovia macacae]|uniref:Uncharacterized protein n=1 Tax=Alloscardovia macacae TaxID=1160091 RepID=A0A1Y2SYW1_9BIFI|nr:hypothetical protein [Alloscardovia macacae]OTA26683.1 hypothetical protein B9G54_03650 [Alloscardovia macacae]OTA29549.1 hypothetical protein B9T39_02800 [Alloscardovia macacae]
MVTTKQKVYLALTKDALSTLLLARVVTDMWHYHTYEFWLDWSSWVFPLVMAATVPYVYWYNHRDEKHSSE